MEAHEKGNVPSYVANLSPLDLDLTAIENLMCQAGDKLISLLHTSPPQAGEVKNAIGDAITPADYEIQKLLFEKLRTWFPDHGFIGEEETDDGCYTSFPPIDKRALFIWTLDPIDGTKNYQTHLLDCAVVIGLLKENEPIFGAAYILSSKTLIMGGKYWPVTIDGSPLTHLPLRRKGSFSCGFSEIASMVLPWYTHKKRRLAYGLGRMRSESDQSAFMSLLQSLASNLERPGSASVSILSVLTGRSDGYLSLKEVPTKITGWYAIVSQISWLYLSIDFQSLDLNQPFCLAITTLEFAREYLQCGSELADWLNVKKESSKEWS